MTDLLPAYVRFPSLKTLGVPWSRQHVGRLERAGQFPQRIRLGGRTVVWDRRAILAWIEARRAPGATE